LPVKKHSQKRATRQDRKKSIQVGDATSSETQQPFRELTEKFIQQQDASRQKMSPLGRAVFDALVPRLRKLSMILAEWPLNMPKLKRDDDRRLADEVVELISCMSYFQPEPTLKSPNPDEVTFLSFHNSLSLDQILILASPLKKKRPGRAVEEPWLIGRAAEIRFFDRKATWNDIGQFLCNDKELGFRRAESIRVRAKRLLKTIEKYQIKPKDLVQIQ